MASLLNLVLKLKEDILDSDLSTNTEDNYINTEDIHRIRSGIKKINEEAIDKNRLDFINDCFDFKSIAYYFDNLSRNIRSEGLYSEVSTALDPLCIYLMHNDYEVSIRKVNLTDRTENHFPNLIDLINNMEDAFYSNNYQSVTTLSSTILQSLFKEICDLNRIEYSDNEKFPSLYNKVKESLNLHPKEYTENQKLRKFSSKIQKIVLEINEIRNLYSNAHGLPQDDYFIYKNVPPHHIKLIVDSTKTVVNFFIESYEYQFQSLSI